MQTMLIHSSVTVPALPLNLAELVLVTAIRSLPDAVNPDTDAAPVHSLLVVLPLDASVTATDLTRAALAQMWWVDLDFASRHGHVGLLNTMFRWQHHRPLTYTGRGLYDAGKYCHADVLEWWYAKREQGHMWFADVEFHSSGVKEGLESEDRSAPVARLFQWYCERNKVAEQLSLQSAELDVYAKKELLHFVSVGIAAAVKHGHLEIIDTIRSWNNVDLRFDLSWDPVSQAVWHVVAETKDLELCQWVLQLVSDNPWSNVLLVQKLAGAAFASGSVEMVEWVLQNKKVDFVLHQALEHASVELTRWAIDEQHLVKLDPETGKIINIKSAEDGSQRRQFKFMDLRGVLQNASKMPVLEWWTENASRLGVSLELAFRWWDLMGPMRAGDTRFVKWWIANCDVDTVLAEGNMHLLTSAVLSGLSGGLELLNLLYQAPQTQPLFRSPDGIEMATCHGLIHVLEWWQHTVTRPDSCLASQLTKLDFGIELAGENGNTKVLTWWAQWFKEAGQGQEWEDILRKPARFLQTASRKGRVETLDWWLQNSPNTICVQNRLWDYMSPRVTRWWIKHGVSLVKTDQNWVARAVHAGNTFQLDYLLKHGYGPANRCEFVKVATDIACQWGRPNVLEWLANHPDLPFEFGVNHVMQALGCTLARHWHVVAWWAGRVKAGDARCMLDMDEIKAAILESESPDHEEDEDSEDEDDADMNDGPNGRLWPLLIKYFLNPGFLL